MICKDCKEAADSGLMAGHCGWGGQWCSCQHHPVGYLIDGMKIYVNV